MGGSGIPPEYFVANFVIPKPRMETKNWLWIRLVELTPHRMFFRAHPRTFPLDTQKNNSLMLMNGPSKVAAPHVLLSEQL